jgi:hypothetical protein
MSATPRHPRLVDAVYAERPNSTFKVRAYRLKKALAGGDVEDIRKTASDMTHDERGEVLEDIAKSGDVAKGYWDPEKKNYSAVHPRLEQTREQPKPKGAETVALGEGTVRRSFRPTVGAIVHFTEQDGTIRHGRITGWGKAGASIASPEGEYQVAWSAITEGVHPVSQAEYTNLKSKADEAEKRRWWHLAETVGLHALTPEQRAEYYKTKANPE